jgi:hypothetical protein
MQKYFFPVLIFVGIGLNAQQPYWQQQLRYTITAELNDKENSITGTETIVYKNNSPVSLDFIWFHLWPNAYKNETTALFQQIKNDSSRSKKLENPGYGYIDKLSFTVNGQAAKTEAHSNPQYIDIIKLVLEKPLAPGIQLTLLHLSMFYCPIIFPVQALIMESSWLANGILNQPCMIKMAGTRCLIWIWESFIVNMQHTM